MTSRKRVLFLTDFSENARHAFEYALQLIRSTDAVLDVLHVVVPEIEASDIPVMAGRATLTREKVAKEVLETFINNGKDKFPDAELEIEAFTRVGNVVTTVISELKEKDYDLIILGNRGEGKSAAEKFLGTVSSRIMQKAHCPVLLVPLSAEYNDLRQVAFASDLAASDPYHLWLSLQLLHPHQPIIRWVHVKRDEKEEEQLDAFEAYYQERAPSIQIHFHELEGKNTSEEIESFVESLELDMLIMVKSHRNLFERIFQPSITRKLANELNIPLFVMD